MSQETIGQRIKFLMDAQKLSIRKFARSLDVSDTNIRNYIDKGTKPSSDILEKILQTFPRTSPSWLLTGEGEPFIEEAHPSQTARIKNSQGQIGQVIGTNHGTATQNSYSIADCEKERDGYKAQLDRALREIELLNGQLQMQATIIEAKDEMLTLLRGGFNRPN